jgi:hypothetical protein
MMGRALTPAANDGFSVRELNQIGAEVARNLAGILEAWRDHCGQH